MKTKFISRKDAMAIIPSSSFVQNDKIALISISDTPKEASDMVDLVCAEIDYDHSNPRALFMVFPDNESDFTPIEADEIKRFVDKCQAEHMEMIIVHCLFGASRSAGVAKYINDYLGLGLTYIDDYTLYNRHVYKTLMEVSGIRTMRSYYRDLE